jgi:hypothetical protein
MLPVPLRISPPIIPEPTIVPTTLHHHPLHHRAHHAAFAAVTHHFSTASTVHSSLITVALHVAPPISLDRCHPSFLAPLPNQQSRSQGRTRQIPKE